MNEIKNVIDIEIQQQAQSNTRKNLQICKQMSWYYSVDRKKRASLVAQLVKNLPAMQKTSVRFLGQEDLLEEGMAIHSGLAWRIPMDRGAWGATVHGVAKSQMQLNN